MLVLFCPQVADGIRMAPNSAGFFAFNSSVYGFFPLLFQCMSILVGSTLNDVADYPSPWNTNDSVIQCPNPFMQFPNSDPAEWIRIGSYDPYTLTR